MPVSVHRPPSPRPSTRAHRKRGKATVGDPPGVHPLNEALLRACRCGDRKAALEALMAGADASARDAYARTGLHWAACHPDIMYPVCHALSRRGASAHDQDIFELTPLELFFYPEHDPVPQLERDAEKLFGAIGF